ncbi:MULTISPECIES: zf-HC2 domain-containing protein [Thalassolituus]|jgi:predicted anti-sigma-YlaC factor YlaD|uniref:zf-HC2 domain-containing protein n=1 Tax=Thalassolituus TaxID=187492 RepID=UPI000EC162D0|nr:MULTISPECIES: zf-HC2 domain-containing protein [Thalassolituus]MEC8909144.1 zf-HC2 domain-containing protein [Pseudomonadota bacterium]HCG77732.1 hypothetical protein [Oceanospirillales bacterium]MEC9409067.1 zf-HC2 domain-containing protein [Pseudomonadota bacterium]MED5440102.1 zf-HC2 domain-containing protein [Pseudomonadota bacterium]MEE3159778.1 zf-HC2 domain-containing protein [Pseudomonadota bacterium]|tara:strand:+ start:1020 stop:1214 length:195 start_codon:yes stop_codon:yes gene_type:complete
MLSCEQATRLLSEGQDRTLTFPEKMNLKVHTAMCSGCREFGRQLGSLRTLIQEEKDAGPASGKK